MSTVKVRALLDKEWDPVTWDRDVWEDAIEAENFEPSDSQGFNLPKGSISPRSADVLPPRPL